MLIRLCEFGSPALCSLCRQVLASSGNRGLTQGFYWSILLIAGVPLIIAGVVGYAVWRSRHGPRPH